MSRRRALVLVNAKSGQADLAIENALGIMKRGLELRLEEMPDGSDLRSIICGAARTVDMVVIGGGDGTLNLAAPAILESGLPLGILPLGTANDLARTLGIPPDPEAAARIVVDGHLRRIDLGEVNGRPFFNVASLGLSVEVARHLTHEVKRKWGKLGYAVTTLRVLQRMRPFSAEIVIDGRAHKVRTVQVAVGNGRYYGGGMVIDAEAEPDDGWLDLYSLEFESLWKLALLYPAFRSGRHGIWREVRTERCKEVEIRTRRPRPVNADGEIATQTPAVFRILPKAVSVAAPVHPPEV